MRVEVRSSQSKQHCFNAKVRKPGCLQVSIKQINHSRTAEKSITNVYIAAESLWSSKEDHLSLYLSLDSNIINKHFQEFHLRLSLQSRHSTLSI